MPLDFLLCLLEAICELGLGLKLCDSFERERGDEGVIEDGPGVALIKEANLVVVFSHPHILIQREPFADHYYCR